MIQQQIHVHLMEEKIESQSLHTITIPVQEIFWITEGKELSYQGKMFDVKEININNGLATVLGIYDFEEQLIKNKINQTGSTPENQQYPIQKLLGSWLTPAICQEIQNTCIVSDVFEKDKKIFHPIGNKIYCNPYVETAHLPPNNIV